MLPFEDTLANLESLNAEFKDGLHLDERLQRLNEDKGSVRTEFQTLQKKAGFVVNIVS